MEETRVYSHDPPVTAPSQSPIESAQNAFSLERPERLRTILDSLEVPVLFTDAQGVIREINPCAEAWLQVTRAETVGKSIYHLHPPKIAQRLQILLAEFERNPEQHQIILERPLMNRWVQMRITALRNPHHQLQGFLLSLTDESEKRQLKGRLEVLEQELLQTQKLSAIGFMASGIAHNLNGPLSVIVGYLDLLYSRQPDLQEVPLILAQTERMKEIISNMMIKSRQEQDTQRRWVDLNLLLQNELKFLEANLEFKNNVKKRYEFARNLPALFGLYSDFSQLFLNLINNALDAMYPCSQKQLRVTTRRDEENNYVDIEDSGVGFEMKDAEKLFTPFYTTKPIAGENAPGQPSGTGLGLSSSLQLAGKYHGDIRVWSSPGAGARFTVIFPIQLNQQTVAAKQTLESEVAADMLEG